MDYKVVSTISGFQTRKGRLLLHQLWTLSMNDLKNEIIDRNKKLESTKAIGDELSFLDSSSIDLASERDSLEFDLFKDIYLTKKKEIEESNKSILDKKNKEKIMEIISRKQDESLESKSIEELKAMIQ